MNRLLLVIGILVLMVGVASAGPCGTVGSPSECTVTINNVIFTASAFSFVEAGRVGPAIIYDGDDVNVQIVNNSGAAQLLFTPNGYTYFDEPGGASFWFQVFYTLTITPDAPGTVAFNTGPGVLLAWTGTPGGDGSTIVDRLVTDGGVCHAYSTGPTAAICAYPASVGNFVGILDEVALMGETTGAPHTSTFSNSYQAAFTPGAAIPEPTTFVLMGAGLLGLGLLRRKI